MNRYTFPKEDVDAAINNEIPLPNFMKQHSEWFTKRKGKLYYKDKLVVPNEERDAYLRNVLFSNRSTMPFGRDSLYHMLKEKVVNISKRYIERFLKAQEVIVKRTPRPKKEERKFVYHRKRAGIVSGDLAHIRHADLPKGYMPTKQDEDKDAAYDPKKDDVDVNKIWKTHSKGDRYFYNIVDIYTGFLVTEVVGTKNEIVISKATKRLIERMGKALGVPVREVQYDMGTEFNKSVKDLEDAGIKVRRMRTNAVVEQTNAKLQRIFYTIVAQKRAGFLSSVNQSVVISNNTKHRKVGMTPSEAVEKMRAGTKVDRVKQKVTPILKRKAYPVGTLVRAIGKREKEKAGFKTYKGKHFGKVQMVTRISWYQGYPKYTLDAKEKNRIGASMLKWHDQLVPARKVDPISEGIVKSRKDVTWDYIPKYKVNDLIWFKKKYKGQVLSLKPLRILYQWRKGKNYEVEPSLKEVTERIKQKLIWFKLKYKGAVLKENPLRIIYTHSNGKNYELEPKPSDVTDR